MSRSPLYPLYFADPFVWKHEGFYYAVGTGPDVLPADGRPGAFPILKSDSLTDWMPLGAALVSLAADFGEAYWAPEVAYSEGRFWLYYSVGRGDKGHHLRVAVSEQPAGPYEDCGVTLTDPFRMPFAIDASPFRDEDGRWYLAYARDFLDEEERGSRVGTAIVIDRLESMTSLAGDERVIVRARHDWQCYLRDRVMYGKRYDWHTIEGPCLVKRQGRYYCLYSAGRWEAETYGVDFVVADQVLGPYQDTSTPDGARVLRTEPGVVIGPGHNSLVIGPDGKTDFIVYHAWDPAMTARRMFAEPLEWTSDGPKLRN